jgi:hypothetical protein
MSIIPHATRAEYDALPGINWSALKQGIGRTRAHIDTARAGRPDKPAFKFGRAFHHSVLQPDLMSEWTVVDGKTTTKPNAITTAELADIQAMTANAALLHEDRLSHIECAVTWDIDGIPCKALIDSIYDGNWLLDLKSTQNAEGAAMKGEIVRFKYHGQCAWYLDGLAANGLELMGAAILAVEKAAPYAAGLYFLNDEWIDLGRNLYRDALTVYAKPPCALYGKQDLDVPEWASGGLTENEEGGIDL